MLRKNQRGFTLVELMIVVIIVGILAAVAIPMYQGATERAKASEAVAALGTIRGAMRVYYAEHGTYDLPGDVVNTQVTAPGVLDVSDNDLLGRYFSSPCYTFSAEPDGTTFEIMCDGDDSTAPQASEVAGIVRRIDQDGDISKS
ncbi:MAG: prepilin-type N-terminal cleavage/methylation domain-containing protein [Candidatus Eisenbacteria bacterium]|nr:prepilin-type N-terminal cleavage/methylation domain-containing protein [Candidatus Eisenbacteria bacterium]